MTAITRQHIDVHEPGSASVMTFRDSKILDPLLVEQMGRELGQLTSPTCPAHVVLSFRDVMFFSSAAIGRLISLRKQIQDAAGTLKLCDMNPDIRDSFRVARLDTFFDIYHTRAGRGRWRSERAWFCRASVLGLSPKKRQRLSKVERVEFIRHGRDRLLTGRNA